MATLHQLLTESEKQKIGKFYYGVDTSKDVRELTVSDLHTISLTLIETENPDGKVPELVLGAETFRILTERSVKQSIPIF